MNDHLPGIFEQLRSFGAPIVHYKTCSTFDSSPQIGSIGRAMEIGLRVQYPNPDPSVPDAIVARGATTIQLRNAR